MSARRTADPLSDTLLFRSKFCCILIKTRDNLPIGYLKAAHVLQEGGCLRKTQAHNDNGIGDKFFDIFSQSTDLRRNLSGGFSRFAVWAIACGNDVFLDPLEKRCQRRQILEIFNVADDCFY